MSQIDIRDADVTLQPSQVQYRFHVGFGDRVVRVLLAHSQPRILFWLEQPRATGIEVTPMSLSLDEIQTFVIDALHRAGR